MAEPWFCEQVKSFVDQEVDEAEEMHRFLRVGIPKLDKSGKLIGWVEKPDRNAIEFFLKTKGKNRGYVETKKIDYKEPDHAKTDLSKLTTEEKLELHRLCKKMMPRG